VISVLNASYGRGGYLSWNTLTLRTSARYCWTKVWWYIIMSPRVLGGGGVYAATQVFSSTLFIQDMYIMLLYIKKCSSSIFSLTTYFAFAIFFTSHFPVFPSLSFSCNICIYSFFTCHSSYSFCFCISSSFLCYWSYQSLVFLSDILKGTHSWDIRRRDFYTNQTCMGRWLRN